MIIHTIPVRQCSLFAKRRVRKDQVFWQYSWVFQTLSSPAVLPALHGHFCILSSLPRFPFCCSSQADVHTEALNSQ